MSVLVDTNVLLRRTQPNHPHHGAAVECVAAFMERGERVYVTPQNIAEFWNVATRPVAHNGLGYSAEQAVLEIEKVERFLIVLPDSPLAYAEWKRLVVTHDVRGVHVHDARLVACMNVHGVDSVLTFNTKDFLRYDIGVIDPRTG